MKRSLWLWLGLFLSFTSVSYARSSNELEAYWGRAISSDAWRLWSSEGTKQHFRTILQSTHEPLATDFHSQSNLCSGKNCNRQDSISYKRAREFVLGDFYLVEMKGEYGIRDLYCARVIPPSEFHSKPGPGQMPDNNVVNVEHTWPQSKFSDRFPKEVQKSDLHHLFPVSSEANSRRSSFPFGEVHWDERSLPCDDSKLGEGEPGQGIVFEPPLAHKGNVARAIFYFSVRYELPIEESEEAVLRGWHHLDPVDTEERERNEKIFRLQKNRNPFVDFPESVEQIKDF